MGHRCADDGQSGGDVHSPSAARQFQRDMTLVVVQRHDAIEGAAQRLEEESVGGIGATQIDASAASPGHGGLKEPFLLIAKKPVLTGVGIESGESQARFRDAHRLQKVVKEGGPAGDGTGIEMVENLAKTHVQRVMDDRKPRHGEHHRKRSHTGSLGDDLRVAGMPDTSKAQALLVKWRRDDGVDLAGKCKVDGVAEIVMGGPSRPRVDLAIGHLRHIRRTHRPDDRNRSGLGLARVPDGCHLVADANQFGRPADDFRVADHHGPRPFREPAPGPGDDFRADARGVTHRVGEQGRSRLIHSRAPESRMMNRSKRAR